MDIVALALVLKFEVSAMQGNGVDGIVDWQVEIGDKNEDGINDYQLHRAISPILVKLLLGRLFTKRPSLPRRPDRQPTPYADTVVLADIDRQA